MRAGTFQDRQMILQNLIDSLLALINLPPNRLIVSPDKRWRHPPSVSLDLSHSGSLMKQHFSRQIDPAAKRVAASTTDGEVYNELNTPLSPDWMIVASWILDRMYLSGIPAHYFLPDPAYLPNESLRFFHIDRNWVDALVDGALSIANHLPNDDKIPTALKKQINEYLERKPEGLTYSPKIPGYGFLLRSELCVKFPDLIVEAYGPDSSKPDAKPNPALILRQENIAVGVLLVMFDKKPGSDGFEKVILREPPHQQAFSAGATLKWDEKNPEGTYLEVKYKKIFTVPLSEQNNAERTTPVDSIKHYANGNVDKGETGEPIFTWQNSDNVDVHALRLPAYAKKVHKVLTEDGYMKSRYTETDPTATLMGIQLNHPMYYLEMRMKADLFPTSSHLSGDDGVLTGLKMLHPPERSPRAIGKPQRIHVSSSDSNSIDWHAPFVANVNIPQAPRQGTMSARLPPAPHVRRMAQVDTPQAQPYAAGDELLMAYTVFPLRDPGLTNRVPKLGVKQDLIFSLLRKAPAPRWYLTSISIQIPYGPPSGNRHTLTEVYDGPGATMVANFRFNVVPTSSRDGRFLILKVVPRAERADMDKFHTKNLSFMLSGVLVPPHPDVKAISVDIEEEYVGRDKCRGYITLKV